MDRTSILKTVMVLYTTVRKRVTSKGVGLGGAIPLDVRCKISHSKRLTSDSVKVAPTTQR